MAKNQKISSETLHGKTGSKTIIQRKPVKEPVIYGEANTAAQPPMQAVQNNPEQIKRQQDIAQCVKEFNEFTARWRHLDIKIAFTNQQQMIEQFLRFIANQPAQILIN